jgi:hypothetical protein
MLKDQLIMLLSILKIIVLIIITEKTMSNKHHMIGILMISLSWKTF